MTFTKAGQCFKASQIDRKYSYGSLVKLIREQVEMRAEKQAEREFEYIASQLLIPIEPIVTKRQQPKPTDTQEPLKPTRQLQKPAAQEPWDIEKFIAMQPNRQVQIREQDRPKPSMPPKQPSQAPQPMSTTESVATTPQPQAASRPQLKPISELNIRRTTSNDNSRPQVKIIPPKKRGRRM